MVTHVSAFGRALCKVGTDADVLAASGLAIQPNGTSHEGKHPMSAVVPIEQTDEYIRAVWQHTVADDWAERPGLAMQPNGMTHGAQWCAQVTLPCYRCGERTQWRTDDRAECLTCYGNPTEA